MGDLDIRVALNISWWEKIIERTGIAERWEYRADDGWRKYWRRNGSIPRVY